MTANEMKVDGVRMDCVKAGSDGPSHDWRLGLGLGFGESEVMTSK